ncbi:MAG: sugar phosphate isomerase/epimerase [Chloroflexota bacterium]
MKLSLSVRVAESFSNKRVVDIELRELTKIAKKAGFEALCMRASMVGIHSPPDKVLEAKSIVDAAGLTVSMVTGDFAVPENSAEGPNCLRNITPFLDLAEQLDSDLIRVCIKEADDIPFVQRASDEAYERQIRLAHQSHTLSLFETVEGSLDVLQKVGRPNFGLIYEPSNLALCGQDYGLTTLQRFSPYLFNIYLQNHVPDPEGVKPMPTWTQGEVMSTLRPLDEAGGIDFGQIFQALSVLDYDGAVTLHHAFGGHLPPQEAATRSANFLRSFMV